MAAHEEIGKSDEYYSPKYIFDALGCRFDLDAAAPWDRSKLHVPCDRYISENSLNVPWFGFVWLNPPFGGRNSKGAWLNKMYKHGNGIVLVPDRTSAPWWQEAALKCDSMLMINGKIKFIRPKAPPAPWFIRCTGFEVDQKTKIILYDGSTADSPSTGTTLFAYGDIAVSALRRAQQNGLGIALIKVA